MRQRNLHTPRHNVVCLCISYLPPLIALGLMMLVMVPYYRTYVGALWENIRSEHPTISVAWFVMCVGVTTWLFGCLLVSFVRCVATPPGHVCRSKWQSPPTLVSPSEAYAVCTTSEVPMVAQVGRDGSLRFCTTCDAYKPDDAHHCHDCGVCIERMDHHCPWINNCVGRDTEKYFVLFLCYVSLTGASVSLTIGFSMSQLSLSVWSTLVLMMDLIGAAVFACAMGGFAGFHLYMLLRGMTTIDYVISRRSGNAASVGGAKRQFVLYSVFGLDQRWWVIMLPIAPKRMKEETAMNIL